MSQPSQSGAPILTAPLPNSWHMVRALGGVGILCSLLIVLTFQATLPIITQNKAEALEQAIFKVLPGATQKAAFAISGDGQLSPFAGESEGERLIFVGYDESGALVGVALEAVGQGFQEAIRILYGYAPDRQVVVGMEVLERRRDWATRL
jgi:electron transport complex protein RnfG